MTPPEDRTPERSYTFELTLTETQMQWLTAACEDARHSARADSAVEGFFTELVEQLDERHEGVASDV